MRTALAMSLMVLLAFASGCRQTETDTSARVESQPALGEPLAQQNRDLTPEQLGELGAQIRKSPERTRELLTSHGLDEKSFEAEIRKVTENPDASKRYAEAYRKASA